MTMQEEFEQYWKVHGKDVDNANIDPIAKRLAKTVACEAFCGGYLIGSRKAMSVLMQGNRIGSITPHYPTELKG